MSSILIRGIPDNLHREIRKFAAKKNLSVNQALLQMIQRQLERLDREKEEQERNERAFQRLKELREEIRRKYGLQEDSTKIIREFRDSR